MSRPRFHRDSAGLNLTDEHVIPAAIVGWLELDRMFPNEEDLSWP